MSGYIGEPDKMASNWTPSSSTEFGHKDSFITRKLKRDEIKDPTSKRRAVERLADLAANHNSVEAAANLALYVGLDLNDYVIREGIINGIKDVEGVDQCREQLKVEALILHDQGDILGFTAIAAIVGYFPPEDMPEVNN